MKTALIIVDVQNDFLPGGSLAVPSGHRVVPVINMLSGNGRYDYIVATKDWHPAGHKSFASSHENKKPFDIIDLCGLKQVLWPDHCIQDSKGSYLARELNTNKINKIFLKGMDPFIDSYSGFFDNNYENATGMGDWLRIRNVTNVHIVGLALDYCIKFTALDAVKLGFTTSVVFAACKAVNIESDSSFTSLEEMKSAGIEIL